MNARQRLLAVLNREPVDRVPIWLLFPYHRTSYYVDVREHPQYRKIFEHSQNRCVMLNRRNLRHVPFFAPDVVERTETVPLAGGGSESRTTVTWNGRTLTAFHRQAAGETRIKKLVDNEDDLEYFCSLPVVTDAATISRALDAALPAYFAEREEFPLEYGAMMLDLGEPVGVLYGRSNLEEYAIWSLTQSDRVEAYFRKLQERFLNIYRYTLERDLADVYFMVGSELASPPLVSRDTFQRWIVPFAKELVDLVHSYGKKVIQHYHGQIREILPDFLTMGADALHTIEAPPVGNCTLTEAFRVTQDRITLIGNIQYDVFRSATPAQMREAVREVLAEAQGHPFILSPTAGPYDPDLSDGMLANYLAFIDAGCELGKL